MNLEEQLLQQLREAIADIVTTAQAIDWDAIQAGVIDGIVRQTRLNGPEQAS